MARLYSLMAFAILRQRQWRARPFAVAPRSVDIPHFLSRHQPAEQPQLAGFHPCAQRRWLMRAICSARVKLGRP